MITAIKTEGDVSLFVQLLICVCELCVYLLLSEGKASQLKRDALTLGLASAEGNHLNSFLSRGARPATHH